MLILGQQYNLYDLGYSLDFLKEDDFYAATPAMVNAFSDGISTLVLSSGETLGNMVIKDGYLQSSNFVSASAGWRLTPTSAELNISTAIKSLDIPDTTTANSFHVKTNADTWWGCNVADFASDNDNAAAYVLKTGEAKFQNITLTNKVTLSGLQPGSEIAIQGWTHDLVFSVTDSDTVAWTSGTITLLDGTTYDIDAGNTGDMATETFVYLDIGVSTTALQTTITKTDAIGSGKIMIAICKNATDEAEFIVFGSPEANYDGAKIRANSITANEVAANTITAAQMNVSQLSAISADVGTLTAGTLTGLTVQTSVSGERVIMTGSKLYLYDSCDNPVLQMHGDGSTAGLIWTDNKTCDLTLFLIQNTKANYLGNLLSLNNTISTSHGSALYISHHGSGTMITASTAGTNSGLHLSIGNNDNTADLAYLYHQGKGKVLNIVADNGANSAYGVGVSYAGSNMAMFIDATHPTTASQTVGIRNAGLGEALELTISKATNNKPVLVLNQAGTGCHIRMSNETSDPSTGVVGDLVVVNGKLKICTVAGTPGTWTVVGTQTA